MWYSRPAEGRVVCVCVCLCVCVPAVNKRAEIRAGQGKVWYCSCLSRIKYVNREWLTFHHVNVGTFTAMQRRSHTWQNAYKTFHFHICFFISWKRSRWYTCLNTNTKANMRTVFFFKTPTQKHTHLKYIFFKWTCTSQIYEFNLPI